jgi:spermidine synthase
MLRERITEHCGGRCEILTVRRAPRFGAHLFVVDLTRGGRPTRVLGAVDRDLRVMEQSAMDLMRPERLVYGYERMMLVAFSLVPEPKRALLLGLGGGAMCRHLAAHLPDCEVTIVERDPVVLRLAREYFHLARRVRMADAESVVAEARGGYDVVLVDLYDGAGAARTPRRFWSDCIGALRPGGCLAVNWAEFVGMSRVHGEANAIRKEAPKSFFLVEHDPRPNIVQLAPTLRGFRTDDLAGRWRAFATARRLPRADRAILNGCDVVSRYPVL